MPIIVVRHQADVRTLRPAIGAVLRRWVVLTLAVFIATLLVDSLDVGGIVDHVLFAGAIGLVNAFIRPVVRFLALPIRIATLGFASLVIDGVLFQLTAIITDRATTGGVLAAFAAALVVSIVSALANWFITEPDRR